MDNHTYNKLDDILQAEYKRGYEEGYAARKEADQKRREEEKKLIHVGDEVIDVYNKTGFVTKVDEKCLSILYLDGSVGYGDKSCFDLTGKRSESIIVTVKQMKEGEKYNGRF